MATATFADVVEALKARIASCKTTRELTKLERRIADVRLGDDGSALLRYLSPSIADRRRALR